MNAAAKTRTPQPAKRKLAARARAVKGHAPAFREVIGLIQSARSRAFSAVNTELIGLYWRVGEYISRQLATAAWGEGVVEELARYIAQRHPELKGFTRASLFRMRQLYDTYRAFPKVAPLVRQLPWSHNLLILGRCQLAEEREFYLRLAADQGGAQTLGRPNAGHRPTG